MCEKYIDWLPLVYLQLRTCPAIQACARMGNKTCDVLVLRLALNPLSYTSQSSIIGSWYVICICYFMELLFVSVSCNVIKSSPHLQSSSYIHLLFLFFLFSCSSSTWYFSKMSLLLRHLIKCWLSETHSRWTNP